MGRKLSSSFRLRSPLISFPMAIQQYWHQRNKWHRTFQ
jgi:hypothetical protein